jgi:hypothetical protein
MKRGNEGISAIRVEKSKKKTKEDKETIYV